MEEFEKINANSGPPKASSGYGKYLIGLSGVTAVGLSVICFPFVAPAFRKYCLPYVPATTKQMQNVFSCLPAKKGRLLDIGSGDGRIVIETARKGWKSDGVELNLFLVLFSRIAALKNGVSSNTKFFKRDLWKFNTTPYDCVVIFGVEQMMPELETKLGKELSEEAKVIACRFPFEQKHLKLIDAIEDGVDSVWVYKKSS
ncbi:ATP synthase subunit C lysine N-methyltransferase [Culicoides brevitarsis]|uniref:ATP synthase subunit C lysine N-methyltransferase n=1 Tax=Culicoides brevitarsis TaxID=469753 RepID=UPI00307BD4A2